MPDFLIDTHAHLTCDALYPEIQALLQRAKESGVGTIVNICTDLPTLERGVALRQMDPCVYNAAATTPHDVEKEGEFFFPKVEEAVLRGDLVAIGETGLDYHYAHSPKALQQEFLLRYLELSKRSSLPLIFHCRDAFSDLFALVDAHFPNASVVLHCFTGTKEEAKGVLERGWFLSLSGIVTFKRAEELREIAKYVPLEQLFLETDAPYLAPEKRRGQVNEPSFLRETAMRIADVKGIDLATLVKETCANARRFFSFSKVS